MRIINKQKKELFNLIKQSGLSKSRFEFNGENEKFHIKFREDFFAYSITMLDTVNYHISIKTINNQKPRVYKYQWQHVLTSFSNWIRGIADDIKNSPLEKEIIEVKFPLAIKRFSKKFVSIYNAN